MPMSATVKKLPKSPFSLDEAHDYRQWRQQKLRLLPASIREIIVPIQDPANLQASEYTQLQAVLRRTNMVIYETAATEQVDKESIRALGRQFGLTRLDPNMLADDDGITSLQTEARKSQRGYIPYSDQRLLWHTDGYYNPPERQIRAMILHCAQEAGAGGENQLLDHELVYLLIRDANPALMAALMAADVLTIPANTEPGGEIRPAQTGPVFSIDPDSGDLHMRYTARTRSIEWKDDAATAEAVTLLESILADNQYLLTHRLRPGQGLIANNVLHNRTAFTDDPESGKNRLVYRARYYDRVIDTHWYQLDSE